MVAANGNKYDGDWKDGKRTGHGVFVFADGDRYEGEVRDGKERGRGVYVWASGDKCEGDWREGTLVGTGEGLENGQKKKCYVDGGKITFNQ
jgi:hypothetical protein